MKLRAILLTCVTAILASLLLARVHPFGDAGLFAAPQLTHHNSIPPQVDAILSNKCADCHSEHTRPHLYGRFAPISWLMERDIVEGRKHLDLTVWDTYTPDKQQTLQALILKEVKSNEMPLPQYRAIHRDSRVTTADLQILSAWAHAGSLPEASSATNEGNAEAGRIVFEKRCIGCHTLDKGHEGPKLRGVFGKAAAQVSGFGYSSALKNSHIVWDETTLDRWLTDPDAFVPGNDMSFSVVKPQERKDLIRFLKDAR
jgi:cytochrome c